MNTLLNTDQAAEVLSIKPWTLRAWVSQGRIPHVKMGRLVRFEVKSLEDFIQNNSVKPRN